MKTRLNCSLYLHGGYHEDISIRPLNSEGYNHYYFGCDDFNIYVRYRKDGQKAPALDAKNRINGTLTPDDVYLSNCPEIVPDPHARAAEILASFAELKRKQEQFEREITLFNNLLPSSIERRSTRPGVLIQCSHFYRTTTDSAYYAVSHHDINRPTDFNLSPGRYITITKEAATR